MTIRSLFLLVSGFAATLLFIPSTHAQVVGENSADALVIADAGKTDAVIVVSPKAGEWEKKAATDLATYIEKLTGAKPAVADTDDAAAKTLAGKSAPVFVIGQKALEADPTLAAALAKAAKPNPKLRADAVVIRRSGNRVYLAGTNDDSHYFAVAELLRRCGCRWYMPTEFGECIPHFEKLSVGTIEYAYGSPFEVRHYWLAWNGDGAGYSEFLRRNFCNAVGVPNGHNMANFVKDLIPAGKSSFNVPIAEEATAAHIAKQVSKDFAEGKDVMMGMDDGLYESDSPKDKALVALQYDKYFLTQSYTDAFMVFYNRLAELLTQQSPQSKAHIGFLIYSNITMPPLRTTVAKEPLVGYLAPIDFDPIHRFDDPKSAPKRELKSIFDAWAKVMQGRLVIYDYDQSMLVWRDLPNPSHQQFAADFKHYRDAGILGIDTESRGAMATVFTNLHLRGQLMWNPDGDANAMLAEFYEKFYGPAAKPMAAYWNAIFKAWEDSIATEHEYFVAPAIYTPERVEQLRKLLTEAEGAAKTVAGKRMPADQKKIDDRMVFIRLSFEIIDAYTAMIRASNTEIDYAAAVAAGERGLAAREKLTLMNGTFTTYKNIGEAGYAWWPGEVQQYKELKPFTDGTKGQLIAKLPLEWAFRRDPKDTGSNEGWEKQPADLAYWSALKKDDPAKPMWRLHQENPGNWEMMRSDIYLQAQGLITSDFQSYTGFGWYQTPVELNADQTQGKLHIKFPGLFNECWLYVNGEPVAHREFKGVWWMNDYRFEWDVDLTGKLKAGKNVFTLRINNPHHMGGLFRRPFLYRAAAN